MKIENLFERTFTCTSQNEAEAFLAISQSCKRLHVGQLQILGEIGEAGWTALAEGFRSRSWYEPYDDRAAMTLHSVVAPREAMLKAKAEDLRTIWDCISGPLHPRGWLNLSEEGFWAVLLKNSVQKFWKEWGEWKEWDPSLWEED